MSTITLLDFSDEEGEASIAFGEYGEELEFDQEFIQSSDFDLVTGHLTSCDYVNEEKPTRDTKNKNGKNAWLISVVSHVTLVLLKGFLSNRELFAITKNIVPRSPKKTINRQEKNSINGIRNYLLALISNVIC
jgi:hypothetical protein